MWCLCIKSRLGLVMTQTRQLLSFGIVKLQFYLTSHVAACLKCGKKYDYHLNSHIIQIVFDYLGIFGYMVTDLCTLDFLKCRVVLLEALLKKLLIWKTSLFYSMWMLEGQKVLDLVNHLGCTKSTLMLQSWNSSRNQWKKNLPKSCHWFVILTH